MTARTRRTAYAVEAVLIVDAAFHLLWATGSTWPAGSVRTLSYGLLGAEVSFAPRLLLALTALALTTLTVIHCRARVARGHRLHPLLQAGTLAFFAFVSLRALAGIAWGLGLGAQPAPLHAAVHRPGRRRPPHRPQRHRTPPRTRRDRGRARVALMPGCLP